MLSNLIYHFLNFSFFLKYFIIKNTNKSFKMCSINAEGKGTEKSPSGEWNRNNCCRQGSFTDTKISGQKLGETPCLNSHKASLSRYLLITKGNTATLQWRNPADFPLSKCSGWVTLPMTRHKTSQNPWCYELWKDPWCYALWKEVVWFLLYSRKKCTTSF